jgi:uncharacterized protein
MDIEVTNATQQRRYEARVDGELAAVADYIPTDELLAFTHTEVLAGFEGRGIAGALLRAALDDVRAQQRSVLAVCPFVGMYVQRHADDFGDLLYQSRTGVVRD